MTDRRRLEATVRGDVQGVGFRWFVQRQAAVLGLDGWVANAPDGSVQVVAEGAPASVERLLALLNEGPPAARVERVEARHQPATGSMRGFQIRAGAHRGD
jgi:acylphosphatase